MTEHKVSIQKGQFENILAVAFAPVVALSELIKNSSDACTKKKDVIRIDIDTVSRSISLKDNGCGLSSKDIKSLETVGQSAKMTNGNFRSYIGEPYAGSKGLGLLTAFNLCDRLIISSLSKEDEKSYRLEWVKGSESFSSEEITLNKKGTELLLDGVTAETISLLTMEEELEKLYSASIEYYIDSENLPSIELHQDGQRKGSTPKIKIEALYNQFKSKNSKGFFIGKALFKYSKNRLILSYEDNIKHTYNIDSYEIDLTNRESIVKLLNIYKLGTQSKLIESVTNFDAETHVDDFEGVYYIWRGKKHCDLNYPYGVRIYINNYGLYAYLNKDIDWLQHSEISQNIKATNFKLKNTFGYVNFQNFNEETSGLKISNERNDFKENLAKKKFMYVMRKFVSTIFSTIDIKIKEKETAPDVVFAENSISKPVMLDSPISIKDLITTNLSWEHIAVRCPENVSQNDRGNLVFHKIGTYSLIFSYMQRQLCVEIGVVKPIPFFAIKKTRQKIKENNSYDLKKLINTSSLKNISLDAIQISSSNGGRINERGVFLAGNMPGDYTIHYYYSEALSCTMDLCVQSAQYKASQKIRNLFPSSCTSYPKISELINEISESYINHPYICMIALRPLIEFALTAFLEQFDLQNSNVNGRNNNIEGLLGHLLREIQQDRFSDVDKAIRSKYFLKLKNSAKRLNKYYKTLDLNSQMHNPESYPISTDVLQIMREFKYLFNFIIDSLNAKSSGV